MWERQACLCGYSGPSSMWADRSRLKMKITSGVTHALGRERGGECGWTLADTGIEDEGRTMADVWSETLRKSSM